MAATQSGTAGLTLAGQATAAGTYITVPSGAIVESITTNTGGSPIFEDVMDENGAFHTRITFEARMTQITIVLVGVAYSAVAPGAMSLTNYYIESQSAESSKGPIRTTLTLTKLKGF